MKDPQELDFTPVTTGDKIQQIVEAIEERILDGRLETHALLPSEKILSLQFNVSRYSLREALRVAETKGLIEIRQGKRPRVAKLSSQASTNIIGLHLMRHNISLMDLIIARLSLECNIASIVAGLVTNELLEQMEINIKQLEYHRDDLEYCAQKDIEFHNLLVKASNNPVFEMMMNPISNLLRNSRIATLKLTGVERALTGHRRILEALKKRDPDMAASAMKAHLEMAEDDVKIIEEMQHETVLEG
jgi:GntR family transcriptional regulator, transcriptional repressor for pyruvate dehydrogenase complex